MSCLDKEVIGEFDNMVADESPTNFKKKVDAQRRKRNQRRKRMSEKKKYVRSWSQEKVATKSLKEKMHERLQPSKSWVAIAEVGE